MVFCILHFEEINCFCIVKDGIFSKQQRWRYEDGINGNTLLDVVDVGKVDEDE